MITHIILCEICDHKLARAHLPNLKRPLVANMFMPAEPGFPDPFPDPEMTWEWMKCPMCKTRPFLVTEQQASDAVSGNWPGPEQVKTSQGMYRIYDKQYPGVPPKVNVPIHDDAELEKEWQERKKTQVVETAQPAKAAKPSSKSSPPKETAAARKARRQKK
jgi:hypothetical protein